MSNTDTLVHLQWQSILEVDTYWMCVRDRKRDGQEERGGKLECDTRTTATTTFT